MLLLATLANLACDDGRRPGGTTPTPTNRDASSAEVDGGAAEADAGGADDAKPVGDADPAADAAPAADADPAADALAADVPAAFDAQPAADAMPGNLDAMPGNLDALPGNPDALPSVDAGPPSGASLAIASARALPNGAAGIVVDGAIVTYVRTQAIGNDLTGFAIQAEQLGPALWIAVDPATLSPPPAVGDRVRLTIDQVGSNTTTIRLASAVSGYTRLASGVSTAPLVQDISAATDVVSNVSGYELELVRANATIAAGFRNAGSFFQSARIETMGVIGDPSFELRLPTAVNDALGLGFGCSFTVVNPLWRFEVRPQLQAFSAGELTNLSCPAARLVTASAPNPTRVILSFDRGISAASITPNGSQVTFTGGLRATAARAVGNNLIVTTTAQTPLTNYQVTVAGSVTDARSNPVDPNFRLASFSGSPATAVVKINEVNANIAQGCDLVELRVERGGSLDGWTLRNRDIVVVTFAGLNVATNQFVVVHATGANATCNPSGIAGGELSSPSEQPRALVTTNFDGAFDWYSPQGGIVNTDTVLALLDAAGNVVDAVLLADDPVGATANGSEDAAHLVASVGEWTNVAGGVPPGGFVDDSFCSSAVTGLNATATDPIGVTLQRTGNADTNTTIDWSNQTSASWGAMNLGQSPF